MDDSKGLYCFSDVQIQLRGNSYFENQATPCQIDRGTLSPNILPEMPNCHCLHGKARRSRAAQNHLPRWGFPAVEGLKRVNDVGALSFAMY